MSFYKYYPKRKDWRKPYYDSRRFDSSCRNHGACGYCYDKRTYNSKWKLEMTNDKLKDALYVKPLKKDEKFYNTLTKFHKITAKVLDQIKFGKMKQYHDE